MNRLIAGLLVSLVVLSGRVDAQGPILSNSHSQRSTPIAINPTNPNNLIVVAITGDTSPLSIGAYYSFDGGTSWAGSDNVTGGDNLDATDPVIMFDPDGAAYLVYTNTTQLFLQKSSDGGVTWTARNAIVTGTLIDKPWCAVSPLRLSGYYTLYASFTNFPSGNISLLKSTDGGVAFVVVASLNPKITGDYCGGSYIAVGPAGEVFVAWADLDVTTSAVTYIRISRSTNGGTSFDAATDVPTIQIGSSERYALYEAPHFFFTAEIAFRPEKLCHSRRRRGQFSDLFRYSVTVAISELPA